MSSFGKEGQPGVCGSSSVGLNPANAVKETGFWSYIHVLYGVCGVQKTILPTAVFLRGSFGHGTLPTCPNRGLVGSVYLVAEFPGH